MRRDSERRGPQSSGFTRVSAAFRDLHDRRYVEPFACLCHMLRHSNMHVCVYVSADIPTLED